MLFLRLRSDIAFDGIWPEKKSFYSQAKATALYRQLLLLLLLHIVDGPFYYFPSLFPICTRSNWCHCLAAARWCCQKFWNTIHVSRMSPISVFLLFACMHACVSFVGKSPSIRKNCVKMAKIQINFFCNKTIAHFFYRIFQSRTTFFPPFSTLFFIISLFVAAAFGTCCTACTYNSVRILIRFFPLKMPKMFSHKAMNHTEHVGKKEKERTHVHKSWQERIRSQCSNFTVCVCECERFHEIRLQLLTAEFTHYRHTTSTSTTSRNQFRFLLNFSAVAVRQLACIRFFRLSDNTFCMLRIQTFALRSVFPVSFSAFQFSFANQNMDVTFS